ncbi:uncharacterized protein [Macaca nemestrina]|uniref:uncharacterized protein n=1 Tax=Macaca nemestrina TaxID=9545 RepID=UPI0039B90E19
MFSRVPWSSRILTFQGILRQNGLLRAKEASVASSQQASRWTPASGRTGPGEKISPFGAPHLPLLQHISLSLCPTFPFSASSLPVSPLLFLSYLFLVSYWPDRTFQVSLIPFQSLTHSLTHFCLSPVRFTILLRSLAFILLPSHAGTSCSPPPSSLCPASSRASSGLQDTGRAALGHDPAPRLVCEGQDGGDAAPEARGRLGQGEKEGSRPLGCWDLAPSRSPPPAPAQEGRKRLASDLKRLLENPVRPALPQGAQGHGAGPTEPRPHPAPELRRAGAAAGRAERRESQPVGASAAAASAASARIPSLVVIPAAGLLDTATATAVTQAPLQDHGQRSFARPQSAPEQALFQNHGQLLEQPQPRPGGRAHTPQSSHQHPETPGVQANKEKKGPPGLLHCPRSPPAARLSRALGKGVLSRRSE